MTELTRKAALAIIEFALHHNADRHTSTQEQIDHIVLRRVGQRTLGIATCTGIVFEQYTHANSLFENLAQRAVARREILIAATRIGIYTTCDTDTNTQNLAAIDARIVDKIGYRGADFFEALRTIFQHEILVAIFVYHIIFQIGKHEHHIVARNLDTCKIDCRIGQTKDVRATTTRGFDLAVVGHNILLDQLLNELGNRRYADVQLLGQLSQRTLTIQGHICNDISLDEAILVSDTLHHIVLVLIEKFF